VKYEVIIGLEVHVELLTRTKLFCYCPNSFSTTPNENICEICLGFPGTLPQINGRAVHLALRALFALNCDISMYSWFDRKNYFYPDIPKGYQTSQYFVPLGSNGHLEVKTDDGGTTRIGITRIHLEEDAGKLVHGAGGNYSGVDYNRAGVPLIEIVSGPDVRSPFEARSYLETLKSIMQYAGVSDCKMEEGSLRCDANVSLRPYGSTGFGEKVELKNMNSFKAVEKALEYEVERQAGILDRGEKVTPQTRRWEEDKEETLLMREKLQAQDYRCFVDGEVAPLQLSKVHLEEARVKLPEMAASRVERYVNEYGLPRYDAEVLTASRDLSDYFEECLKHYPDPKQVSNWIMSEFLMHLNAEGMEPYDSGLTPKYLSELLKLIEKGYISGKIGKEVLQKTFYEGKTPVQVVEEEGLEQITDQAQLEELVDKVIEENPSSVEDYRNGKKKALGFLVGQVMKQTGGKANPQLVNQLFAEKL